MEKGNVSQREEGYGKIKLLHFQSQSKPLLQQTVNPNKIHTMWGAKYLMALERQKGCQSQALIE